MAAPGAGTAATTEAVVTIASPVSAAAVPGRLLSVDVARGLTLMVMVVVNNPGDWGHIHPPLRHSHWHGFTPADFVFPNFLFLAGLSIALALARRREAGLDHGRILLAMARRCAILFLLGLFITAFVIDFDFASLRIPGVLQRIAVVSFLGTLLCLKLGDKALAALAFAILGVYYVLLNHLPEPGHGPANLDAATHLGAWLDRRVFGEDHLFRFTRTWDPEGLLSTLPALATGLFGILAGALMLRPVAPEARLKRLFGIGAAFIVQGAAAHPLFPVNKNLWTSSYVLLTSGLSLVFLGLCYWIVDMRGWKAWTAVPAAFGMNSIFAYLCEELLSTALQKLPAGGGESLFAWIYRSAYVPLFESPMDASLAWSLTVLAALAPMLLWMRRRRITIKL